MTDILSLIESGVTGLTLNLLPEDLKFFAETLIEKSKDEGEADGPQFYHFKPLDNWHPKPVDKETDNPPPAEDKASAPLPHERKSRLTPGEVAANKAMRANPHIPDDAKPPLPEGYE